MQMYFRLGVFSHVPSSIRILRSLTYKFALQFAPEAAEAAGGQNNGNLHASGRDKAVQLLGGRPLLQVHASPGCMCTKQKGALTAGLAPVPLQAEVFAVAELTIRWRWPHREHVNAAIGPCCVRVIVRWQLLLGSLYFEKTCN